MNKNYNLKDKIQLDNIDYETQNLQSIANLVEKYTPKQILQNESKMSEEMRERYPTLARMEDLNVAVKYEEISQISEEDSNRINELLSELSDQKLSEVLLNPEFPPTLLESLARFEDRYIRKLVAQNPNLPVEKMFDTLGIEFPLEIVENSVFNLAFLEDFDILKNQPYFLLSLTNCIKDRDLFNALAINNIAYSSECDSILKMVKNPNVLSGVYNFQLKIKNNKTGVASYQDMLYITKLNILNNPNCPENLIQESFSSILSDNYMQTSYTLVKTWLQREDLSLDLYNFLVNNHEPHNKLSSIFFVSKHFKGDELNQQVENLVKRNPPYHFGILKNPNLNSDQLNQIYDSMIGSYKYGNLSFGYIQEVIKHPEVSSTLVKKIFEDITIIFPIDFKSALKIAIENPNITNEAFDSIPKDKICNIYQEYIFVLGESNLGITSHIPITNRIFHIQRIKEVEQKISNLEARKLADPDFF
jgi:hypothetical protein